MGQSVIGVSNVVANQSKDVVGEETADLHHQRIRIAMVARAASRLFPED